MIREITDYITSKTSLLNVTPEVTPNSQEWSMFTDAGTETEVGEFLYSITRMTKPLLVLETGTHIGVSASYIGLGMKKNKKGQLLTFEIIPQHFMNASKVLSDVGVTEHVKTHLLDVGLFDPSPYVFDMLFLDSEPQLRFDEFTRLYPYLKPGGIILIHDLHPSLGHHGQTYHGTYDWPYGDFREKLGPYIKNHLVQTISFGTPRGLTMFQKAAPHFEHVNHILGVL